MPIQKVNIGEMKYYSNQIKKAKTSFDDSIKLLKQTIAFTEFSWTGTEADEFRQNVSSIIKNDLSKISKEFEIEIKYLDKVSSVLENAEEQVKKRLNI